jgi:hypothetical protein
LICGTPRFVSHRDALDQTLRLVLSAPALSEIVFSFVASDDVLPPDEVDFVWYGDKAAGYTLSKVGRYPQLEERIPPELEQELKADDLEFYKRASRCRN